MSNIEINWPSPPENGLLAVKGTHVWAMALDLPAERLAMFRATLSPDELERADRLRFEQGANRFVAGRGFLRTALGRYVSLAPATLKFDYGAHGKPTIANLPIHFNLAHSHGLALLAVSKDFPIGVDVELIRPVKDIMGVAERFFSPREKAALEAVPTNQRAELFFKLWTCKEAWLKATGEGIAASLDKIELSLSPDVSPRILSIGGDTTEAAKWTVQELHPAPSFKAALVAPAAIGELHCWRWPGLQPDKFNVNRP